MLNFIFVVVPILALGSALLLNALNGKRELIQMDFVQFVYAFVVAPVVFIWFKSFIYFLFKTELGLRFSPGQLFIIDTFFSTTFLYIYAFIVIHTLTKSFQLKLSRDPLYDLFHHSEYFHLWLTHIVFFSGSMLLLTFVAFLNAFIPLKIEMTQYMFYGLVSTGVIGGLIGFVGLWVADPKQEGANFMRLMKLVMAFVFLIHVVINYTIDPKFNGDHALYWWSTFAFATGVICSAFAYKSTKAQNIFQRFATKLQSKNTISNIQLFKKSKRKR